MLFPRDNFSLDDPTFHNSAVKALVAVHKRLELTQCMLHLPKSTSLRPQVSAAGSKLLDSQASISQPKGLSSHFFTLSRDQLLRRLEYLLQARLHGHIQSLLPQALLCRRSLRQTSPAP